MRKKIFARTADNEPLIISIRCDDECKNGHDTWAITADLYKPNTKTFSERNLVSCGCLHDEILKAKPSLKPFIDLHLADGDGSPMYAIENGFYGYMKARGIYSVFEYTELEPVEDKDYAYLQSHLRVSVQRLGDFVSKIDAIIDVPRVKYLRSKIYLLHKEIGYYEDVIKQIEDHSLAMNVDEAKQQLDESKHTLTALKDELSKRLKDGKREFAVFVDSLRQEWQAQSDHAKELLATL